LRMPNTFFRRYSAGDLAERASIIDQLQERVTGSALTTLLAGIFSLLNFLVMFSIQPRLALIALALVTLLFVVVAALGPRQERHWREIMELRGALSSMVLQMVSGISRVRLAGAEDRMFVRWSEIAMRSRELYMACYNVEVAFGALATGYQVFAIAVIFGVAGFSDDMSLTTGGFLAFVAAFAVTMAAVVAMTRTLLELVDVIPTYRRVRPLLLESPENEAEKVQPGVLSGRIEVYDLVFRYGKGMPLVLQGLSFSIEPGQYVAIVGASGCGKSTLLRLILGFETPNAGSIYFDGKDLAGLDLRELRHQIGVVLQQDQLMEASIYENIRGDNDISVDEAWRAARLCGISDDVAAMPLGMHTIISAQGTDLSGGQVQRLLIARALAARPRILLLDEATSALDNQTQAVVTKSLERLRVTRLAIAHRLSTVMRADRILVIDGGRAAESGTYDELMKNKDSVFAGLVRRQLL
jgi:ABC-type bacteriocin/lantibiotic exporter with double-glycine peptidase domain